MAPPARDARAPRDAGAPREPVEPGAPVAVAAPAAPGPAAREALAVLCRALLDDLDGLTDRLTLMILDREDVYAELGVPLRDDLRATCRASLARSLTVLAGDLPADVEPAAVIVDTGARRARQGVPLEVVLRAYRLCGRLLWDRMVAISRDRFGGAYDTALLAAANDVWRMIDHSSARLVDAYRTEETRVRSRDEGRRYSILEGLLEGRGRDPAYARDAARVLGLDDEGGLVCVVVLAGEPDEDPGRPARDALAAGGLASVWHARVGEVVGLVPVGALGVGDDAAATVTALLAPVSRVPTGVSPAVPGLAEADTAHRQARLAARTLPAGAGAAALDDRLPEALLAEAPEPAGRLGRVAFAALLDLPVGERDTLLDTLAAVLDADGSPSRAAAALYCHRNTVMYRLARVEKLTGRRLADPRDRLLLALGLLRRGEW